MTRVEKLWLPVAAALGLAGGLACAHRQTPPEAEPAASPSAPERGAPARFRLLIPQDIPVRDTPPDPPPDFERAAEGGAYGVRIELEISRGGAPFQPVPLATPVCNGDHVAFRFTPSAAGYAAIANHGTSGAWSIIWPALPGEDPAFGPDRPVRLPAEAGKGFPVSGPAGDEFVVILFSPEPFSPGLEGVRDALLGAGAEAQPPPAGMRYLIPSDLPSLSTYVVGDGEQTVAFSLVHAETCAALPTQGAAP